MKYQASEYSLDFVRVFVVDSKADTKAQSKLSTQLLTFFQLTPVASCASNQGISKEMLLTIIVKLLRQPPTILPKFQWLPFKQRMSNLDDAGQTVIITISFTIA